MQLVFTRSAFTQHTDKCNGKQTAPKARKNIQRAQGKAFAQAKNLFLQICAEKFNGNPFSITCGCPSVCQFDRRHDSVDICMEELQQHFEAVPAISPEEALRLKRQKEKLEAQAAKVEEEKKGLEEEKFALEEEKFALEEEKFALEAEAKSKKAKRDWLQMANEQMQKELMEQQEKGREMQRRHDLELHEAQSFCVVCRTGKPSIHLQPCQRVCRCRPCWERIQEQTKKEEYSRCPLCRRQVVMWSPAYLS
eukprot:Skav213330  [mRNA]  locus=scaffold3340:253397:254149:+ [translate_table: standard]